MQHTISNHGVRKFWIYWTLHLLTWNYMEHLGNFDYFFGHKSMDISPTLQLTLMTFPLFLQMREEIGIQLMKLEDFMEYSRYLQNPSQAIQAKLTQRQRKFELFNPSQA